MKRCLVLGGGATALLLLLVLLWPRGGRRSAPATPEARAQALAPKSTSRAGAGKPAAGAAPAENRLPRAETQDDEKSRLFGPEATRAYNETQNVPVAFYGLVVDQDSNTLQNVVVDLAVEELYRLPFLAGAIGTTTRVQRETGADGRFEVSGLKGHFVTVRGLTRDGYEPEVIQRHYGEYGAQSTSPDKPAVFRLWSTSLHEALVTGQKGFVVVPDGRRYAIDLLKGTMAEGQEGDLVAWIKRPESVRRGQRYDWSCEVTVPGGGLQEGSAYAMSTAPESGYTNVFAYREEATVNGWGPGTGDKRFYVRLRNGRMYGRIVIGLDADYHGKQPAMISLSYAVNPSGSRLLR